MRLTEEFDHQIKNGLVKASQGVDMSSDLYLKIKTEINKKGDKVNMKGYLFGGAKRIRIALVSAVCIVVLTGTVVGAVPLIGKYVKGYISEKDYSSLPTQTEILQDTGFKAKLPQTLPGGFVFDNAGTAGFIDGSKEQPYDDTKKEIGASYRKADTSDKMVSLTLSASNTPIPPDIMKYYQETASNNNKKLYYRSYMERIVDHSYELTAKDKEDELSGKVNFIYGGTKDGKPIAQESYMAQSVLWEDEGVYYTLYDNGYNLSQEKLTQIVEAVINHQ